MEKRHSVKTLTTAAIKLRFQVEVHVRCFDEERIEKLEKRGTIH